LSAGAGQGAGAGAGEASGTGGQGTGFAGGGGGRALLPGVRILADVANNSVVVYANAETYRVIERALNQLDRPQAQVELEVTIAEVHLNNALNYGVQFFLGNLGIPTVNTLGAAAVNSPSGSAALQNQPGFNIMLGNKMTPHVIISALNQYTTTKILSNPSLVVLDNQTAALQVGSQVPISTGSTTFTTGTATSNTISYQNTGIILSFRPHIHANGNVNLEIDQEISAVDTASPTTCSGGTPCPTFTDRHVKSQIQVPNGQTVLLAGLIQEEQNKTRSGIPLVEQIPIIGEAFSPSNSNTVDRIELIFFIRPQVIRDGVDASNVAEELRSKMRGDKVGTAHPPGAVTPYPIGLVQ
jgi:general secretion pathway protein D